MNLGALIILGVGLSIDSLAASLTAGACSLRIRVMGVFKIALFMAVFQALMPLAGWLIGSSFKKIIENYDHWVAFFLLFAVGGKMIYEGLKKDDENKSSFCPSNNLMLIAMAVATSIDALVVGIGFGLISLNIWLAILLIGVTTFIFSASGVVLGMKIGNRFNRGIEIFGGLVLIGLGFKILISHIAV